MFRIPKAEAYLNIFQLTWGWGLIYSLRLEQYLSKWHCDLGRSKNLALLTGAKTPHPIISLSSRPVTWCTYDCQFLNMVSSCLVTLDFSASWARSLDTSSCSAFSASWPVLSIPFSFMFSFLDLSAVSSSCLSFAFSCNQPPQATTSTDLYSSLKSDS